MLRQVDSAPLPESWEAFADAFGALERPLGAGSDVEVQHPGRQLVDLVLPSRYLGWELADELARLAPYGPGHLEPVLAVTGLRVGSVRRIGARETHISFRMLRGIETVDAIGFGMDVERSLPEEGSLVDLVGTLERDTFGGMARLRLRVLDYADAAASPLLARRIVPVELARAG